VACRTCKSPDTNLKKENRLYFLCCESCGSTRSVATIKKGFEAQIGKRKKEYVVFKLFASMYLDAYFFIIIASSKALLTMLMYKNVNKLFFMVFVVYLLSSLFCFFGEDSLGSSGFGSKGIPMRDKEDFTLLSLALGNTAITVPLFPMRPVRPAMCK
jgi:hypothetical protein